MKTLIIILILASSARAGTSIQTQDIGSSAISFSVLETFTSTIAYRGPNGLGIAPGMMILVSSGSFTTVTAATVTLPSPYTSFFITGVLQNKNGSARSLFMRIGGDQGTNYKWSVLNEYTSASPSTEYVGCNSSSYAGMSDTVANTDRVGANSYVMIRSNVELPASSVMLVDNVATLNSSDAGDSASHHSHGVYSGATHAQINFGFHTVTSCTADTVIASAVSGTLYVFAMPF